MAPEIIKDLKQRLDEAMARTKDPYLTIDEVAAILGADVNCIRSSIYNGTCPFGFGYGGTKLRNGYSKIPKLVFYNWMTKTNC
jgi:hypothetical protein